MDGRGRILEPDALRRMHAAAVATLQRTGVRVEHAEIRRQLAGRKGFHAAEGRVRIDPERIAGLLASAGRPAEPVPPGDGYVFGVGDYPRSIVDRDGRSVRPMTRQDVIDGAKLIAVLADRGVRGTTCGVPTDCPPPMQPIEQFMIAAEFAPAGGRTHQDCDIPTGKWVREMNKVYGRPHDRSVYLLSPLVMGGPSLETLWHFREGVDSLSVGSMPTMGINGPCDLSGIFTLSVAECLGGAAILGELVPHLPIRISPHPQPADMSTGKMIFGTPEWELLDLMHRDVHEHYGQPFDLKRLRTSSPVPDAVAAGDHARSAVLGFEAGYRHFGGVGQLSMDEVFSPAMAVLDLEILAQARRVGRGAEFGSGLAPESLPEVVDEVVREGMLFAEHPTTPANLRNQYHRPAGLTRRTLAQWLAAGSPDVAAEAQAEADRLVGLYEYEPPRDILRDLKAIYERAKVDLL